MDEGIIYYGSNVKVATPQILVDGYYKDFGYAFYCTDFENHAKRWAMTRKGASVVNRYRYVEDASLKILSFPKMTEEWLDFVVDCRRGIKHSYDIVEGPMADDLIWNFVEWVTSESISRTEFWEFVKFNCPMRQIAFCNEDALGRLSFEGSDNL